MLPRKSSRSGGFRAGVAALVLALFFCAATSCAAADTGAKIESFKGWTYTNDEFSLDPYLGKVPIVLDFGSIYCSTCVQSIPHLIVLQEQYGSKVKIVGVNLDTSGIGRVKKFFSAFSGALNFPILLDKSLAIANQFNVITLPTYIIIDKDGKIVSTIVGYDEENRAKMDSIIDKVIKGESLAAAETKVGSEIAVLSPSNFTMTYQSNMWVVGSANGNKGPFTVKLNGGSPKTAKINGDSFQVRIPLCYGSNFIEVSYPKGDVTGTQAVVLFRDPRMGEGSGVNFPEYKLHMPEKEKVCAGCHEMAPNPEEAKAGMSTSCQTCHGYQTEEKFVHGPIPVGGCPACHDFNSKPHRYTLTDEGSELCFTCHGDVKAKFQRDTVHGPVAMGLCAVCHNPHSAPYKFQLRASQASLCISCHEDMREKVGKFVVHKPVAQEQCTNCHDPHSSDNPEYFLVGSGEKLCFKCHTQDKMARHSHPTSGPPPAKIDGMPLDKKGELNCKSCHDPHASDEARLTTFKGGCNGCHDALKKALAPPPPPPPAEGEAGAATGNASEQDVSGAGEDGQTGDEEVTDDSQADEEEAAAEEEQQQRAKPKPPPRRRR
ncbi:redoxin domain-containing protein [bacterium]|nr:MAG: redoxin domain-containing protein [bacterium]